jgi:hypothetical protein
VITGKPMDVKRFSRAADSYWRLRAALQDYENPVDKIEKPKYMETRVYTRRIVALAKCEDVLMRELLSIKTGRR